MISTLTNTQLTRVETGSSALSMAGFVGLYFGVRACLVFLFFQSEPQNGAILSILLNLGLLVVVAFYAAGPGKMNWGAAMRVWPFRFVLLYLGLSLASLAWTEAQSAAVAGGYWLALAADVALVLLVLKADPTAASSDSLLKGFVYGVGLLAVVAWLSPAQADLRIGDDDFLSPNVIGFECAMGTLLCQYLAPQGARWKWLGVALAVTLMRSLSKTSIIAFLVAESFYLLRTNALSRANKIAIVSGALFTAIVFSGFFMAYYTVYTNAGTQAETLTGRTSIWLVAGGLALEEPWLGHGFHSFHSVVPIFGTFQAWHAHNEWLQQFFSYGIAGVALVAALYISLFRQLRRHALDPLGGVFRALLLLVFVRSFVDTERFDISLPLWMITLVSLTLAQTQEAAI
ncbi:O-antigen ligase family protein [Granulicella tundricola]|uniref:O-antigen polymerase n=1 Tax=Granulicella tundricola (strain ATCC BAA-1859 / DSM 23138 / MP5ACTX9) TaxID=1198114 RepID=E8WZ53_GRATM|nr:O-antigen ligase family protein [Granulicella tundricola]ADW67655.1 O-antigen polymerase [Granulicella tundricola MP5ACTX9]